MLFSSFRASLLLLAGGFLSLGCDDGTTPGEETGDVEFQKITRETVGDSCSDDDDCGDDGNTCTTESCDLNTGLCISTNNGNGCDDGFTCTDGDSCSGGVCQGTPNNSQCDDSNACTDDLCDPNQGASGSGCFNPNNSASCDDSVSCTTGDTCSNGSCQGSPDDSLCNNDNECESYTCDQQSDCQRSFQPENTPCDDKIPCTEDDTCDGSGVCSPGSPNNSLCAQPDCAVGICRASGCDYDPESKEGVTCRLSAGACDIVEVCDGKKNDCPADQFQKKSFECIAASCDDGLQVDQVLCSGSAATCAAPTQTDCGGFACTDGAPPLCRSDCSADEECLGTHYCDSGLCSVRTGVGANCGSDQECGQGDRCVDGVCCNTACSGQCEACDIPGSEGQCMAVSGEPHPGSSTSGAQRSPCATDSSSCGGTCDGSNRSSCAYPVDGTVCLAASCDPETNSAVDSSLCNGSGQCVTPSASGCGAYTCDGDDCRGDCSLDSHCEGALQCNGGMCVGAFEEGSECTLGSQCDSGSCVDGVCCESSCPGQCEACNVKDKEGQCVASTGDPVGSRPTCAGSGDCAGSCDGSLRASCTFPQNEISCRSADCEDGRATLSSTCDGAGECPARQRVTCQEGCEGDLCADGECAINGDCEEGEVCRATVCVAADEEGNGCSVGADCSSGYCVDGLCCDSACGGQCEACNVEDKEGSCSPVPSGEAPHGARQACASDGSACGGICDGESRDACSYPEDTECRSGSCEDGIAALAATCNGSGFCPTPQEQDCGTDGCNENDSVCDGTCVAGSDACKDDEFCSAGICLPAASNATSCASDNQCESGNCVDGYCCDSACKGQCSACDIPGFEGSCSTVQGSARGNRPACEGSGTCGALCDGKDGDSCSFPEDDVFCGGSSCENGVVSTAPTCDGAGECRAGAITSCSVQLCDGNACAEGCSEDSDCLGQLVCLDGQCEQDLVIHGEDNGTCGCRIPGNPPHKPNPAPLAYLVPLVILGLRQRRRHSLQ